MNVVIPGVLEFEDIIAAPDSLKVWPSKTLLLHFLEVRFVVMTESHATSSARNRVTQAIQVGRLEYEEILRRMKEGHDEPPF